LDNMLVCEHNSGHLTRTCIGDEIRKCSICDSTYIYTAIFDNKCICK